MNELRNCPFCGSVDVEADERVSNGDFEYAHTIRSIVCNDCQCSTGWYSSLNQAIAAWNTRAPVNEWISVEDGELPETYEPVIGANKTHTIGECYRDGGGTWRHVQSRIGVDDVITACHVTHWQPLPAPPHETTENEKEV